MKIPYEEAVRIFQYDEHSGAVTRKITVGSNGVVGTEAGTLDQHGYVMVRFERYQSTSAHRLAFLLMTGDWPRGEVDHLNGCRNDNRWCNLEDVSVSRQKKNTKIRVDNPFGIVGVQYDVRYRLPWYAVIHSEGNRYIERFDNFFDACCARRSAELRHKFHPNHGRK